MKMVKIDRYKLTWWAAGHLCSQMFPTIQAAEDFAKRSAGVGDTYLIMESAEIGDGAYRWRVLPFGAHRFLSLGQALYENRVLIGLFLFALGISIAAERDPEVRKLLS